MILKDGFYRVDDLFYENAGFTLAVAKGRPDFFRGTGPETRFRAEVLYPELDFSKPVGVPGFSKERGEFAKNMIKTVFAASTTAAVLEKNVNGVLEACMDMSWFEKSFFMSTLMNGGTGWFWKDGSGRLKHIEPGSAVDSKLYPDMAKTIMTRPAYRAFLNNLHATARDSDGSDDAKLQKAYMNDPTSVPEYAWTESDAKESIGIMKASPLFRAYIR